VKRTIATDLVAAVARVLAGQRYFPSSATDQAAGPLDPGE